MDTGEHTMHALFEQLGLDGDEAAVQAFIRQHSPLPEHVPLGDAPFWNDSQAAFLREAVRQDADWAVVIDQLSLSLRGSVTT